MMYAVVYLVLEAGQVTGRGLFTVIRENCSRWLLYFFLVTAVVENVIEAGADLGGMAAALNVIVPIPISGMVAILGVSVLSLQLWNYTLLRSIFRWLAIALLAYLGSAFLSKPELLPVLKGTFIPTIHFNKRVLCHAGGSHRNYAFRVPVFVAVESGCRRRHLDGTPTIDRAASERRRKN